MRTGSRSNLRQPQANAAIRQYRAVGTAEIAYAKCSPSGRDECTSSAGMHDEACEAVRRTRPSGDGDGKASEAISRSFYPRSSSGKLDRMNKINRMGLQKSHPSPNGSIGFILQVPCLQSCSSCPISVCRFSYWYWR